MDLSSLDFVRGADEIAPILAGYSSDRKFQVRKDGESFLLKVFEPGFFAERNVEFEVLGKMAALHVRASRPLEIGTREDFGYMLLTYLEGEDAAVALPKLSAKDQFRLGFESAEELRKIHLLEAPAEISSWEDRKLAKHKRYLEQYLSGDLRLKGHDQILRFIEKNLSLMKGRPNLFQHDDFHPRNLIVKDGSLTGVIDFQRHDWGDPIHDFIKVGQFTLEVSAPFATGQILGYFGGRDPDENFWKLYSLYLAVSVFGAIVWTKHVCPDEMPGMIDRLNRIATDHDFFELLIPKWYKEIRTGIFS